MMKSKEIEFAVCFTHILQGNTTYSNTKSRYFKKAEPRECETEGSRFPTMGVAGPFPLPERI